MALVHLNFESQYLQNNTDALVILPDRPRTVEAKDFYEKGKKYPVLWLLHGTFGDYTDWIRKSNIELYACENDLIVVMPSALNSDYVAWEGFATGYDPYRYILDELMPLVHNWLPASSRREDNFIAGLSMGGFGATMLGVNNPDKFAAVASLSAPPTAPEAMTMPRGTQIMPGAAKRRANAIANAGGEEAYLAGAQNTWRIITEAYEKGTRLPRLYFSCGKEDFLYPGFQAWKKHVQKSHMDDIVLEEVKGYTHEWRFWDLTIQHALDFFGVTKKDRKGNEF